MKLNKLKQGKKNRASGVAFERRVRKDLESKGWIVDKWSNNVEFFKDTIPQKNSPYDKEIISGKLIPAKRKYNPFNKALAIGTGFPDFIAFKSVTEGLAYAFRLYEVIGVEAKSNGYLTKEEKAKCKWLIENNIFHKILIASKGKKRREIIYKNFEK